MQYPLTEEAKLEAIRLAQAWDDGQLDQMFQIVEQQGGNKIGHTFLFSAYTNSDVQGPRRSILWELSEFKLLRMSPVEEMNATGSSMKASSPNKWIVLLLQELRNAVANNFEVSDFYLTTTAVGTIIYGNNVVENGGSFHSAAAIQGNIVQTTTQAIDSITRELGPELLEQNTKLRAAIQGLREGEPSEKKRHAGKVIEELGRCLGHVSNTGGVLLAIQILAKFLGG